MISDLLQRKIPRIWLDKDCKLDKKISLIEKTSGMSEIIEPIYAYSSKELDGRGVMIYYSIFENNYLRKIDLNIGLAKSMNFDSQQRSLLYCRMDKNQIKFIYDLFNKIGKWINEKSNLYINHMKER